MNETMNEFDELVKTIAELTITMKERGSEKNNFTILLNPEWARRNIFTKAEFRYLTPEVSIEQTITKILGFNCEVNPIVKKYGILYELNDSKGEKK